MISITCNQCRQTMGIDDAFAGGVCRCQNCGTIQTVPGTASGAKTLYQKEGAPSPSGPVGSGLDDLADIVASSGLAGSGLGSRRLAVKPASRRDKPIRSPAVLLAAGGAALVIVLVGIIVWLVARGGSSTTATATRTPPTNTVPTDGAASPELTAAPPAVTASDPEAAQPITRIAGPSFCGVRLDEPSVVYLLDHGEATAEAFDALKAATYKSLESLGAGKKFAVIFWSSGGEELAFPDTGLADATPAQIAACRKKFEDVNAYGSTDLARVLPQAAARQPALVVLATGKGAHLEDDTVAAVQQAFKPGSVKIHTFSLGDSDSPALKKIAEDAQGQYQVLHSRQLRAYAQ